jgi:type I restriction enzyme S subunit
VTTVLDEFQLAQGWSEVPFRAVASKVSESGFPELESLSVFLDAGVVPRSSREDNHNQLGESLDKYQRVLPNDLVFNKLRTWQGGFGISKHEGIVSPAYIITRPNCDKVEPRFLGYLLKSKPYLAELTRLSKWMPPTQFDIAWESIRDLKLRIPLIDEQRRIADYLDEQIAIIDQVIVTKLQLVEKYREIYDSYRHRAVIGASNKNKMPTTLQWIPEVPDSWNKLPLRSSSSWGKGRDSGRLDVLYCGSHPGEFPVYSGQTSNEGVFANIDTFDFDTDALCVLMSTVGALAGSTRLITGKFSLSQNCAILFPKIEVITAEYLNYLWPTIWSVLKSKIPSDMQPSVRFSDLSEIWIYAPTVGEQSKIVEKISGFALSNDVLLRTTEKSIEKLSEYKTSLITAAVTGQFDVTTGRSVA